MQCSVDTESVAGHICEYQLSVWEVGTVYPENYVTALNFSECQKKKVGGGRCINLLDLSREMRNSGGETPAPYKYL